MLLVGWISARASAAAAAAAVRRQESTTVPPGCIGHHMYVQYAIIIAIALAILRSRFIDTE